MDTIPTTQSLLWVRNLRTHIDVPGGVLRVLDGVDIEVGQGRTVCIGGEILLRGKNGSETDLARLDPYGKQIRSILGRDIGMIFPDPINALSPVHTIGNQMEEAIHLHEQVTRRQARERSIEMLHRVGMQHPAERLEAYSFQLSGGMRQRAMIALALVCSPSLLLADEPTTALDVITQAQILDLKARCAPISA